MVRQSMPRTKQQKVFAASLFSIGFGCVPRPASWPAQRQRKYVRKFSFYLFSLDSEKQKCEFIDEFDLVFASAFNVWQYRRRL